MSLLSIFAVSFGAGCGSLARYLISLWFSRYVKSVFPWATWFINMSGTLALALSFWFMPTTAQDHFLWLWLGPGFCGGFTTFSTMVQETIGLVRHRPMLALVYIVTSLGMGLGLGDILSLLLRT
ncbi:fluoride efflux transporter FluC [Alicyclobacillus dauci]|uniref:Fluoride-specific ion channel FluC n=1 Tax=Alicyclobacillus dauci TaxID=1475485 RepID=A0ABY6Z7E1_9BACL|nr:CrcB family protein [Alicyclobacillus dauci]WAH38512.1 CrcB family protein [Alicyclobacillus dauci]